MTDYTFSEVNSLNSFAKYVLNFAYLLSAVV